MVTGLAGVLPGCGCTIAGLGFGGSGSMSASFITSLGTFSGSASGRVYNKFCFRRFLILITRFRVLFCLAGVVSVTTGVTTFSGAGLGAGVCFTGSVTAGGAGLLRVTVGAGLAGAGRGAVARTPGAFTDSIFLLSSIMVFTALFMSFSAVTSRYLPMQSYCCFKGA